VNPRLAGSWSAIDTGREYTVVTNNYIAGGKDGYTTFGTIASSKKVDTYTNYAQGFIDYLQTTSGSMAAFPDAEYSTQKYKDKTGCDHACNGTCGGRSCTVAACPSSTPAPPPAGTTAPADTKFFVTFTATLPYTKADFTDELQTKYKAAVAKAAGTTAANVEILKITEARRRAGSVEVETKIRAKDKDGQDALATELGTGDEMLNKLNTELKAQGLEEATGVTAPVKSDGNLGAGVSRTSVSWVLLSAASALVARARCSA
jgi:hypothetical protein